MTKGLSNTKSKSCKIPQRADSSSFRHALYLLPATFTISVTPKVSSVQKCLVQSKCLCSLSEEPHTLMLQYLDTAHFVFTFIIMKMFYFNIKMKNYQAVCHFQSLYLKHKIILVYMMIAVLSVCGQYLAISSL